MPARIDAAANFDRYLWIAVVAVSLLPLWSVYFPPLLDYPEHVLLTQVVAARHYDAGSSYNGRLELRSLWAPYSLFYFIAVPLARLVSAMWAVRIVLTAIIVATALALRWLVHALNADPYCFYLGYPFFFSTAFLSGVIPFLAGIPPAIVLFGVVVLRQATTKRNFLPRLALAFLIVWAHPVLYVIVALALVPVLLFNAPRDRHQSIAAPASSAAETAGSPTVRPPIRGLLAGAAWLFLPGLYLAAWERSMDVSARYIAWEGKLKRLADFAGNLGPGQAWWLVKLPLLAWLAWAVWAWLFRRPRGESSDGWPRRNLAIAVAGLALLAFLLPEVYSGRLFGGSFRAAPLALMLAGALVPRRVARPIAARLLLVAWCVAVLASNAVLARSFDRQMSGFVEIEKALPPGQPVILVVDGASNLLFHHVISYYHLAKGGISPQNFLTLGGIRHYPAALPPPFPWGDVDWETDPTGPFVNPAGQAFKYVVLRTVPGREPPENVSPPHFRQVTRARGWVLFEHE